mmetsp:Transcript_54547/g.162964  ORF Transcript_54547/g.162964 Transcript_54547/m.162964 type:complete len:274 (+) Transcript_54547:966-1787(+)
MIFVISNVHAHVRRSRIQYRNGEGAGGGTVQIPTDANDDAPRGDDEHRHESGKGPSPRPDGKRLVQIPPSHARRLRGFLHQQSMLPSEHQILRTMISLGPDVPMRFRQRLQRPSLFVFGLKNDEYLRGLVVTIGIFLDVRVHLTDLFAERGGVAVHHELLRECEGRGALHGPVQIELIERGRIRSAQPFQLHHQFSPFHQRADQILVVHGDGHPRDLTELFEKVLPFLGVLGVSGRIGHLYGVIRRSLHRFVESYLSTLHHPIAQHEYGDAAE